MLFVWTGADAATGVSKNAKSDDGAIASISCRISVATGAGSGSNTATGSGSGIAAGAGSGSRVATGAGSGWGSGAGTTNGSGSVAPNTITAVTVFFISSDALTSRQSIYNFTVCAVIAATGWNSGLMLHVVLASIWLIAVQVCFDISSPAISSAV